MSIWSLLGSVVDETVFKSHEQDDAKRAAVFPATSDPETDFFGRFLSANGFEFYSSMTEASCAEFELVLFCFTSACTPNEDVSLVDCSNEKNVIALVCSHCDLLPVPSITPAPDSATGVDFLLKVCHASIDVASSGKRTTTNNIVAALGASAVASRGILKQAVGSTAWYARVGGLVTWHCKVSTSSTDDGRRVGSILKRAFAHGKVGFFKDFKGVYVEARKKSISRDAQALVRGHDTSTSASSRSFIVEVASDEAANELVQDLLDDSTVGAAEVCYYYKVETPHRTLVLCEALKNSAQPHPDYSTRIVGVDTKAELNFKKKSPAPPQVKPASERPPAVADHTMKVADDSPTQPLPPQTEPVQIAPQRTQPSQESVMLMKLVSEMDLLKLENQALRQQIAQERDDRHAEMKAMTGLVDGIKAKAADHALVEAAINELRDSIPTEGNVTQLVKNEVNRVEADMKKANEETHNTETRSEAKVTELQQIAQEQAIALKRFQQGTGLAIDKLHSQLGQLDQLSSHASQSIAAQVQQLQTHVQAAASQGQQHGTTIQQLQQQQQQLQLQNQQQHQKSSSGVELNQVRSICAQSNDDLRIAVSKQLQNVERRLHESEGRAVAAATTAAAQAPTPTPAQVETHSSGDFELVNAKMARTANDVKALDGRVQHLEMLQAEVTSLLDTSATQAEKFHALDDKIDDLQIKVDAISAAQH